MQAGVKHSEHLTRILSLNALNIDRAERIQD
jgi:hypothetical protein